VATDADDLVPRRTPARAPDLAHEAVGARRRDVEEHGRALRERGAAIALKTAEVLDHRVATLEAMGVPEERIQGVRDLAASERRVAAEWSRESRTR